MLHWTHERGNHEWSHEMGDMMLTVIIDRSLSSHVYNQDEVAGILVRLTEPRVAFEGLLQRLEERIATQDAAL